MNKDRNDDGTTMALLIVLIMITSCTTMIRPIRITFLMGNTRDDTEGQWNEKPVHEVIFTYQFILGNYEITFNEYDAYCTATGNPLPNDMGWGRGTRPVINVSWFDAIKFCNWRSGQEGYEPAYDEVTGELLDTNGNPTNDVTQVEGYRLPTDAEWEYEARGGSLGSASRAETNDYKYSGSDDLDTVGWYTDNSTGTTQPVGGKAANELGKYDMSGNVWEWVHDWSGVYNASAETNPTGPIAGSRRVTRGGSWINFAESCRVARRAGPFPSSSSEYLGFRLARIVF